jgi:DNA-binding transcriptional LysR family regulator
MMMNEYRWVITMEMRHLKTFKVITETGGFTRAAEVLGYAQSSVTAHIKALEAELGTPLFDRIGKRVILTQAGERLLPYANEVLRIYDRIHDLSESNDEPMGHIYIGASESLTTYRLPCIIYDFKRLYPKVKISLKPITTLDVMEALKSGELDVAFVIHNGTEHPEFKVERLTEEKMMIIRPPQSRFPKSAALSTADQIIFTERGSSYRLLYEQYLEQQGVIPESTMEFWSIDAIKQCVMCGLGVSLLPEMAVRHELDHGLLDGEVWDGNQQKMYTSVMYHKDKWMTKALQLLIEIAYKRAEEWCPAQDEACDCHQLQVNLPQAMVSHDKKK